MPAQKKMQSQHIVRCSGATATSNDAYFLFFRPEGPALNSPGRQAGGWEKYEMSAEGAALKLYELYE